MMMALYWSFPLPPYQTRDRSGIAWKPSNVRAKLFVKTTGYGRARYQDSEEVIFFYVASPVIS